jgi:hypothetical protein
VAYSLVENFLGGVDRTRPRAMGAPGTLWSGINGHITRGGDFEKRKAFKAAYALPAGTFGLSKSATNRLTVFGSNVAPSMPADVDYVRLQHPTQPSMAMTKIASVDLFNGKQYVIPRYDNGDYRHFYDGSNVADWGAGGNNPSGYGTIVRTHRRKVYSPIGSLLWFSELDSATNFDTTASGSGFVNVSNHQSGSDTVTGLAVYQQQLALFSRLVIQLWEMADDDASNAPAQYLFETGTRAPKSITGFGDIDVFYLSDSGVRSLRARSGTNIAGVNDVGTPIDPLINEWVATLTDADIENSCGIVEPKEGRYWLAIGNRVFVFTYFPSKKVSAWTWYEPGVTFTDFVNINGRVYARAGDVIYLYGGANDSSYDTSRVTAELPFISGGKPGTYKQITGFDFATRGTWDVKLYVNPDEEDGRNGGEYLDHVALGEVEGITYMQENIGAAAHATHVAPKFVHEAAEYASISQFAIHNDGAETSV